MASICAGFGATTNQQQVLLKKAAVCRQSKCAPKTAVYQQPKEVEGQEEQKWRPCATIKASQHFQLT